MKKKLWIPVVALLLLGIVCTLVLSQPRNVFDEGDTLEIYRVAAYRDGSKEDITQQVKNPELLAESLLLMETARLRTSFAPFANEDVRYEISGTCGDRTMHILLSDDPKLCVVYEDGDKGGWQICRAEHILAIVDTLCTM